MTSIHDLWKTFVDSSLAILQAEVKKGVKVYTNMREVYHFQDDGGFSEDLVFVPDYAELVERYRNSLESTNEYKSLSDALAADSQAARHFGQSVLTFQGGGTRTIWDYVKFPLVEQMVRGQDPFLLDTDLFEKGFAAITTFFASNVVQFYCVAPLQNFRNELDEIELGDGLKIRRIKKEESERLLVTLRLSGGGPSFKVLQFHFVVELLIESPKRFGDSPSDVTANMDPALQVGKVVTALRIFKEGNVASNSIQTYPAIRGPFGSESTSFQERLTEWGNPLVMKKGEAQAFKEFWDTFKNIEISKTSAVNVALRRFNFAYERTQLEDKLIDLMIAFEALFLKENEASSVHKLTLRFAKLLGKSFEERQGLEKEMKNFYRKRSAIVHGEVTQIDGKFVLSLETRLRSSLKSLFPKVMTKSLTDILTHLDLD
jgi:hypothetical protein